VANRKIAFFFQSIFLVHILTAVMLCAAGKNDMPLDDKHAVYKPLEMDDWAVSTPAEQGIDPNSVLQFYQDGEKLPSLYSLLVIKNGFLVAEKYFNGQKAENANPTASVTKSILSALVGIALREGFLLNLDQKMMPFFPELKGQDYDPRKNQITIRHLIKMRSGYPRDEADPYVKQLFTKSNWIPFLVEFPVTGDPGSQFAYCNFASHILGIIVSRAANMSLLTLGERFLFDPLDMKPGFWPQDSSGYYIGAGEMAATPRDLAKFGLMYLQNGSFKGTQVIPKEWAKESLRTYSQDAYKQLGTYFRNVGYGYLWWSANVGNHSFHYAWGHGGQLIIILHDLNMVVVSTADNLFGQFGEASWKKEGAVIDLMGSFIYSLPME